MHDWMLLFLDPFFFPFLDQQTLKSLYFLYIWYMIIALVIW